MLHKHSVSIKGHPTSFSLEDEFYKELKRIAATNKQPLASLITKIDRERTPDQNLSSAIRVFVLNDVKAVD
ncbi:MAG: ribbon-helix-helix domain-containing protein [Rhizobiaceae bacterium]|nr:ribbon-helix-helix domain-containing protein [Rhizobiaceae bacterium]